jgi:hypothetical protein
MKTKTTASSDDMRAEYDFDYSKAVRGKYYRRLLKEGANVVVLARCGQGVSEFGCRERSPAIPSSNVRGNAASNFTFPRTGGWRRPLNMRVRRTSTRGQVRHRQSEPGR